MIKITDVRANKGDSAFLIDDGTACILYDSGFAFTGFQVAENIKSVLGNRKLDYIFLTHSHYDHILGSVYALKYWPDAKVVASEYAAHIISKPSARALMRELDRKFAKACGVNEYEDYIDELRVDISVCNGDRVKAGNMEFEVIALPGHTKCSVGFYYAKEKLLLCSETIGVYDGTNDVVPSYLVGYQMALDSIDKLSLYDIERILIPHCRMIQGEQAKRFLAKSRERAIFTAHKILQMHKQAKSKEEIMQWFKDEFYHGYIKEIYPKDAMELNTGIMIDLIIKELA